MDSTIAVAATFTAEPLEPALQFWLRELALPQRIEFAPYNQVFQQILDPAGMLAANTNGVNVVLIRLDDWRDARESAAMLGTAAIERNGRDFIAALRAAQERAPASYLICLCPAPRQWLAGPEQSAFFQRMEERLATEIAEMPGVYFIGPAELMDVYPVADYDDEHADKLAHVPFTPLFFTALGTMIARKIRALKSAPYKVIALDCDETLWKGTCGEDGPLGIRIDSTSKFLQEFMVQRHDAGMLLCLCSKNNEEDVAAVFEQRRDMPLARHHIASSRVNWKSKSENLKSLAEELNLGLDGFIFIDDNPVECAEVESNCPEVLTLRLPRDGAMMPKFFRHFWAFDRLKITAEDRQRSSFYRRNAARESLRRQSLTFGEFLAGLALTVEFSPLSARDLARASDLTQRTNQFNTTTIRRSEAELQNLCMSGETESLAVRVQDRFGDYGLVGLILFRTAGNIIRVDTFLLSCRALGKGVEHRMLAKLGEIALARGLESVEMPLVPTAKNRPAREFIESLGQGTRESSHESFLYRFAPSFAAQAQYIPPGAEERGETPLEEVSAGTAVLQSAADARARAGLLSAIALELCDVEEIHKVISAEPRLQPEARKPFVAPGTPLEKKVAAMWSELLGLPEVGKNDSFFNLGGHSLLAMQVLSRIHKAFDVELSPRLLYTTEFTVASLSETILTEQTRQASPQEVDALIRKLEGLSDDEVQALLDADEDDAQD
jgi:FkbH-like protein